MARTFFVSSCSLVCGSCYRELAKLTDASIVVHVVISHGPRLYAPFPSILNWLIIRSIHVAGVPGYNFFDGCPEHLAGFRYLVFDFVIIAYFECRWMPNHG